MLTGARYCAVESPPRVFWIRRDVMKDSGSPERALFDRLQADGLSAAAFQEALAGCTGQVCQGVMHTAYRFMPELREAGLAEAVIALFEGLPRDYLEGWRRPKTRDSLIARYSLN